jgi:hypothetical protein
MSGSGHGACGGMIGANQPTHIRTHQMMGVKTFRRLTISPVGCGAARSTTAGACGVPFASGGSRTTGTTTSGFGWWCAHAVDPLASVPLVSGGESRGDLSSGVHSRE